LKVLGKLPSIYEVPGFLFPTQLTQKLITKKEDNFLKHFFFSFFFIQPKAPHNIGGFSFSTNKALIFY